MQLKIMPYSLNHSIQSPKGKRKLEAQMFENDCNHVLELATSMFKDSLYFT